MKPAGLTSVFALLTFNILTSYGCKQLDLHVQDLWLDNLTNALKSNTDRNARSENPPYHSQFGQDSYLNEHFFKNKRNGVFVDIGAHNGITFSNTYFLEKTLNWTGICIEPMPHIFSELIKNRKCVCINGCVADFNGKAKFIIVSADLPNIDMFSGLYNKYDPQHLANINATLQFHGGSTAVINVNCFRLECLLAFKRITHIDYLSLDTEGGELDILKSIDFTKIDIDIIDVENNYADPEVRKFLEKNGYEFVVRLSVDEIYKKKDAFKLN